MEKAFAILPRKAESANIRDTKPRNNGRYSLGVGLVKLTVHQCAFGPIHKLRQRDLVMEIRGNLVSSDLLRNRHA